MKATKKSLSVLPAVVLAFGVLSLTARADTNCGVRTVAITVKPVYYMPDRVVQRACTCTCHGRKAGESSFVRFFKDLFFNHIQMPLWALFKNKGHRTCFCGRIHY